MIKNFAAAIALATGLAAAPAAAVTYDAFTSFDGTQGAGNFFYGSYNLNTTFPAIFEFSNTVYGDPGCAIAGSICLQSSGNSDVPGVYKSLVASFQFNSVNVPTDRLLVHPGNGAGEAVYVAFSAPTTGTYTFTSLFSVQDVSPSGVDLYRFTDPGNGVLLGSLSAAGQTFSNSFTTFLGVGDTIVAIVSNGDGSYNNDSTGLNFTATTVPEPATWGLMIVGFGLVGMGMRRKVALAA